MAEMRRLIFEAPIQELADAQGISIDEARTAPGGEKPGGRRGAYRGVGAAH